MENQNLQNQIYKDVKNPYEGVNVPKLGFIQRALDWLGLTNTAEQNRYQLELMRNQWDTEHSSSMADIDYNNPTNQAKLMREAGLNPDLLGVSQFEASSSGNPSASLQPDLSSNNSAMEGAKTLANAIVSGFQMFIGAKEGFLNIKDKVLEYQKKFSDYIESEGNKAFGQEVRDMIGKPSDTREVYNWRTNPYLSHIKKRSVKKAAQRYIDTHLETWQNISKELYKQEKDYFVTRNEAEDEKTKFGWSGYEPNDLAFVDILADYNNLKLKEQMAAAKFGINDNYWKSYANDVYYNEGFYRQELSDERTSRGLMIKGQSEENRLKSFQNEVQKMQLDFYRRLNNDPSGIGQFILFNILNSSGASMLEGLASGAMKVIPQTRYFHHLR